MQARQRSWSVVWAWTSCRVQMSYNVPSVALEWAATASSAMAASTGCTSNTVDSSSWQRTLITDVHGTRELHTPWTADHRGKDSRPQREVQVGPAKLEVVASFCYLGAMLSAAGGCELSTTTCLKIPWKKFKELLPVLSSRHLSLTLKMPGKPASENVVCLLNILANFSNLFLHTGKQCGPWSDCSEKSSLIWVHTVCKNVF